MESDLPLTYVNNSTEVLSKPLLPSPFRFAAITFRRWKHRNQDLSPFLSGDSFASMTDYVAFGRNGFSGFDVEKASQARSIFVKSEMLERLIDEGGKYGIKPDVIISGNSDRNFTQPISQPLDCKLWLCQNNANPTSESLRTLPIGLENMRRGRLGQKKFYIEQQRRQISTTTKVLVPPMKPTNPERFKTVKKALLHPELFDVRRDYLSPEAYFNFIKEYQFVLCLEGNGFENHRIWECLYLQIFPVVISSPWSITLRDLGLPIMFIDSIEALTQEHLEEFVAQNSNFKSERSDSLWTPFWKSLIDSTAS